MKNRINAGYTIIEAAPIEDDFEVVLGKMDHEYGCTYVTWMCKGGNNYFWGHYFPDVKSARIDLHKRVLAELGG